MWFLQQASKNALNLYKRNARMFCFQVEIRVLEDSVWLSLTVWTHWTWTAVAPSSKAKDCAVHTSGLLPTNTSFYKFAFFLLPVRSLVCSLWLSGLRPAHWRAHTHRHRRTYAYMHKIIHTKSYIHAYIHTHSLIHAHSHTLAHTHSFTLTRLLICLSHTHSHTHTLHLIHTLTHI